MAGPAGLQPAISAVVIADPGAPPEIVHGGPADAAHGTLLWADPFPYPWLYQAGVATPDATVAGDLLGRTPPAMPAGTDPSLYASATETGSHAAPWPAFGTADSAVNDIDAAGDRAAANALLHSLDTGDPYAFEYACYPADVMPWELSPDYVSPGQSILSPDIPDQLRGQMGRDRLQGLAPINRYGFDSAHVTRHGPVPTGDVPGNFLWLDGSQRPLRTQIAGRITYPTGTGSYFEGQDPGAGSVDGAVLTGLPTSYQTPPEPPVAGPGQYDAAPVWGWG